MQRHPHSHLTVLDPLSDTIPRTLLHSSDERAVVDDAIEHLSRFRTPLLTNPRTTNTDPSPNGGEVAIQRTDKITAFGRP